MFRGGAGIFYDRTGPQPIFDLLRYDGQRLLQYVVTNPAYPDPWNNGLRAQASASYAVLRQIESSGRLESHSLEVAVRGDVTRVFSGMMQYTLGRAYNNTAGINSFPANNYDLSGEWGRSDFDQRHRFNLLGTVKPGRLFNLGIGVFLNTGRPYSLTTGRDDYHVGSATARPAGVGRNTLAGPGYAEYDLRWFRDFKLAPPHNEVAPTMTVSVDAFNVFNQVN